jgi:hypothetical protein
MIGSRFFPMPDVFRESILRTIEFYFESDGFDDNHSLRPVPSESRVDKDGYLGLRGRATVRFILQICIWGRENSQMSGASQSVPPKSRPTSNPSTVCSSGPLLHAPRTVPPHSHGRLLQQQGGQIAGEDVVGVRLALLLPLTRASIVRSS